MHLKFFRFLQQNPVISILFLVLITSSVYSAFYASNNLSTNSDAIVYPYLFRDIPAADQLLVSDKHSNILKMPLFALQGLFTYNYTSFMIFNIILYILTILGWVFLCIKIFGKRSSYPVLLTAIVVVLTAHSFNNELIYSTVRNIEYPIILFFFYLLARLVFAKSKYISKKKSILFILYTAFVAVMIAGDQFFVYIGLTPALLVLIALLFNQKIPKKRILYGVSSIIGIFLGSLLIKAILDVVGLYDLDKRYLSETIIPSLPILLDSVLAVINQWFYLVGTAIPPRISSRSLVDLALIIGVFGTIILLVIAAYNSIFKHTKENQIALFVATILLVSSVVLVGAYVMSGLAFQGGDILDSLANVRYMTLLPLVLIFGAGLSTVLFPTVLNYEKIIGIIFIIALIPALYSAVKYNNYSYLQAKESKISYINLANSLKQEGVTQVLSGYWYGAALRFWSEDTIHYSVVAECNKPSIENARRDWYKPNTSTNKSALIIDMSGRDLPFLGFCSGEKLQKIYGKANKEFQFITSPNLGSKINIWIFNYDIRSHTQPILTAPDIKK